jgi:hypothetical protein
LSVSTGDQQTWDSESAERSRSRWIFLVVALILLGGAALVYFWNQQHPDTTNLTASSGRLTLEADDGGSLAVVDRQSKPEVWYRVVLENAPVGAKLTLKCDWITPSGNIAHQNRYQTHPIDKEVWPTHARYRFGPASPAGVWRVELSLDDRVLHSLTFRVQDGNAKAMNPAEKLPVKKP